MKKIYYLFFMLIIGFSLKAQEVISSGGKTETTVGYEVSWTIGEPVIKTISSGTNILTQGFHQSKLIVTAITEILFPELNVKVFPNPTQDYVIIQFNKLTQNPGFSLFDLSGKLLQSQLISASETHFNLSEYANGTYLLKLNQDLQQPLQTFKIVKH